MDNGKTPDNDDNKNNNENNPIDDLKKQLEGLFGGKAVKLEFGPPPFGVQHGGDDESQSDPKQDESDEILKRIREFSMKPREVRDYLNRFVIKQDEAKKVLSVAICDHYNHVRRCLENPDSKDSEYAKQNILILGPTGVGKTYLMRTIAKLIGVPFVKADATKFSETGYVGADVEDLVRDLVKTANGNVDVAQYGIVYIDEIDKIAGRGDFGGKDVSGRGVQINLLKLMEESNVNVVSPQDMMGQMQMAMSARGGKKPKRTINTRHILFIVSGAFDKLGENIAKRMNKGVIGFASDADFSKDADNSDYLKFAETSDFIKYGFEAEFIGRLPVRVACESLKPRDIAEILVSSEGSILRQYKEDFDGYGIEFSITPEAVEAVSNLAYLEKTGARGLMTVLERILRDHKFELPSSGVKHFELNTDTVENPKESLQKLLLENSDLIKESISSDILKFSNDYKTKTGYELIFSPQAVRAIIAKSIDDDKTASTVCEELFKDFEHGLAIVSRNSGAKSFEISAECIADPDKWLSDMVVKSFDKNR